MSGGAQVRRSPRPLGLPAAHLPADTYIKGILGAIILGVLLSCLLGLRHSAGRFLGWGHPWVFMSPGTVVTGAMMFFSPGIALLSLMLFSILKQQGWLASEAEAKLIGYGALIGMGLGLMNIPIYLWWFYMPGDWPHMAGIALATGAAGGAWIGHQIRLTVYPQIRRSPRKSLAWVALILGLLGVLLLLYSPHEAPPPSKQEIAARPEETKRAASNNDPRRPGRFVVSPAAIDLGNLELGSPASSPTISVTAEGALADLRVVANGEDVSIEPISSCSPVLATGAKCTVVVRFLPRFAGNLRDGIVFSTGAMTVTVPIIAVVPSSPD